MRLKSFKANSLPAAMELVRQELGADAIILSTHEHGPSEVEITAAREPEIEPWPFDEDLGIDGEAGLDFGGDHSPSDAVDTIAASLAYHGVPAPLIERLRDRCEQNDNGDPLSTLAATLADAFSFRPLSRITRPIAMIGPAGVGKTLAVAKSAARAVLDGQSPRLLTFDVKRSGGVAQLASFAELLHTELGSCTTVAELAQQIRQLERNRPCFIDSPSVSPYAEEDLVRLAEFVIASRAEPVLVLAAGGDPEEQADVAKFYARIGVSRFMVTQIDMVRRLGGLLTAAEAGGLAFAGCSIAPFVGQGLHDITAENLADLLLRNPDCPPAPDYFDESIE